MWFAFSLFFFFYLSNIKGELTPQLQCEFTSSRSCQRGFVWILCVCLSAPPLNPSLSSRLVRLSVGPHRDAHHRHIHSRVLPIYEPQAQSTCILWPSCFFLLCLYSPLYLIATFCAFKLSEKTRNTSRSE